MRKLILSWLLAVVAIGGCASYQYRTTPIEEPATPLEEVCNLVLEEFDVSCGTLLPPILVLSEIVRFLGADGVYVHDEKYIFVSPTAENVKEVQIHETVHYVLWELDLGDVRDDSCASEALARDWAARIVGEEEDPTWRKRYGC